LTFSWEVGSAINSLFVTTAAGADALSVVMFAADSLTSTFSDTTANSRTKFSTFWSLPFNCTIRLADLKPSASTEML
jgi:hypothetical protein